jgi:hypothetical protein
MANIFSHHELDLTSGVMAAPASGVSDTMWGNNALQTVTVARHRPRDPQQAIGYRGIVDYTSGQQTSDFTLDCILTEQTDQAVDGVGPSGTSIYKFADDEVIVGQESYVLTSCNVGFTAGSPATVSYGYLTTGIGSALSELGSAPDVLKDGEESYFAVVMGDDGSGVQLVTYNGSAWVANNGVAPSGVQSLSFSSTINKDNVLDIRAAQPIQFITTYPIDITCDIETYDKGGSVGSLTTLGVSLANLNNHADRSGYTSPSRDPGVNFGALSKNLVLCRGLILVDDQESLGVGGYVTYSYNYTASDIAIPLGHIA